ncbi:MAG: sulfurtransferase TusA family protein [Brevundimonas sp.]|nr:sulfurtransferase TusA family protein [Brevundimonas sp.]
MIVDARGHRCPVPTLRLRKAMATAGPDRRLTLLATDPMARIDAPHLAAQMGWAVVSIEEADGVLTIIVETPAAPTD